MTDSTVNGTNPVSEDARAIELFHFNNGRSSFEDLGQDNGFRYWLASDLASCLGYQDYEAFRHGPLNKAFAACAHLNIPIDENFVPHQREKGDHPRHDFKLSRFACYLAAMNGDSKKEQVARAQMYFAVMAESFRQYLEDANDLERLSIRDEITGREKSLSGVAHAAGVAEYAFFQNAGYRGLYNMNLSQLKQHKGMPSTGKSLLDFMGKTELAANLFRITQTEAKIQKDGTYGQKPCEAAAESVGKQVRATMQQISGSKPEDLPLEGSLQQTRKNLKHAHKSFKKLDTKPKQPPRSPNLEG